MRVIALQSFNESDTQSRSQIRVFVESLLTASPARIAKDVDIRAPERQSLIAPAFAVAGKFVVFGARFRRSDIGNIVNQVFVPSCRKTDGLGKDCGIAGARHP